MTFIDEKNRNSLYGAIDLGTNTCRLIVGRSLSTAPFVFSVVNSFCRIIHFGEDLATTKTLSTNAIERALLALEECDRRLRFYRVPHLRCVATAACREAENAEEFLLKVYQRTGLKVEIISAQEESELAVAGCIDLFAPTVPYGIVFDIGGGSTEVVFVALLPGEAFQVLDTLSLPYGILALRDPICSLSRKQEISDDIAKRVHEFASRNALFQLIGEQKIQMIGASGTVTTLAAMVLKLERYDRKLVHKVFLAKKDIYSVIDTIKQMSKDERLAHPCIGPQRVDFILGVISLLQGIYRILEVDTVMVADRGVKEGILRKLIELYPPSFEQRLEHCSLNPSAA